MPHLTVLVGGTGPTESISIVAGRVAHLEGYDAHARLLISSEGSCARRQNQTIGARASSGIELSGDLGLLRSRVGHESPERWFGGRALGKLRLGNRRGLRRLYRAVRECRRRRRRRVRCGGGAMRSSAYIHYCIDTRRWCPKARFFCFLS